MAKKASSRGVFNTVSIRGRVNLSILVVVGILLVSIGFIANRLNHIAEQSNYVIEVSRPSQIYLMALQSNITKTNNALQNYLRSKGQESVYQGERKALWANQVKSYIDSVALYEKKWQIIDDRVLFGELTNDLRNLSRLQRVVEDSYKEKVLNTTLNLDDNLYTTTFGDSLYIAPEQANAVFEGDTTRSDLDKLEGFDNLSVRDTTTVANDFSEETLSSEDFDLFNIVEDNSNQEKDILKLYLQRVDEQTRKIERSIERLYQNQNIQIQLKQDSAESQKVLLEIGLAIILILLISIIVFSGYRIIQQVNASLQNVENYLGEMAEGNVPLVKSNVKDETVTIVYHIDTIARNMANIRYLAEQVGEGKFETNINIFNNQGEIGSSLSSMRDGLKVVANRDRTRNWVNEGFALFAEILRDTADVQKLYDNLVNNLVKYVDANQGGVFIASGEEKGETYLELKSCYAFDKKKFINQKVELGQGLVGQCWQEGNTIYLLKVPEDYVHIGSGLGEKPPRSVLIVPIKVAGVTYGVIELASFHQFTATEKEFVEGLGEDIASTISSIRTTEQTQKLLVESREITNRMVSQEEQMRQNMEELAQTQEELEKKNSEMGAMMVAIQKSTVVMEFDEAGNFLNVNKRFTEVSQYEAKEVIGKHRSFYAPKDIDPAEFNLMWSQLTQGMHLERNVRRTRKDGTSFWLRASFFPVFSEEGRLIKVTCIATDVTEKIAQENKAMEDQKTVNYRSTAFDKAFVIFETDRNFIVKNINGFGCSILEVTKEQYLGKHIDEAIIGRLNFKNIKRRVQSGGTEEGILVFKSGDKSFKYLSVVTVGARDANLGTLESIFFIGTDITKEKLYENQLVSKVEALEANDRKFKAPVA